MKNNLSWNRLKEDGSGSAYDKESMAIIKLNNTTVLYLKEVTKFLALVCILREESFERKGNGILKRCLYVKVFWQNFLGSWKRENNTAVLDQRFSTGVLQEFLEYTLSDYSVRSADLFFP